MHCLGTIHIQLSRVISRLLIVELWIGSFNKREDILGLAHKNLSLTTTAFPPFVTNFVWVFEFVSISVGWLPDWAG